jgi:excisionase family DNA binding protein
MEVVGGCISVAEAARQLKVTESYAYRLIREGRLRVRKLDGMILVLLSSVRSFRPRGRGRPRKAKPGRATK